MTDNTRKNILFTRFTGIGCVMYLIAVDAAAAAAGLTPTLVEGQTKPNNKRKKNTHSNKWTKPWYMYKICIFRNKCKCLSLCPSFESNCPKKLYFYFFFVNFFHHHMFNSVKWFISAGWCKYIVSTSCPRRRIRQTHRIFGKGRCDRYKCEQCGKTLCFHFNYIFIIYVMFMMNENE